MMGALVATPAPDSRAQDTGRNPGGKAGESDGFSALLSTIADGADGANLQGSPSALPHDTIAGAFVVTSATTPSLSGPAMPLRATLAAEAPAAEAVAASTTGAASLFDALLDGPSRAKPHGAADKTKDEAARDGAASDGAAPTVDPQAAATIPALIAAAVSSGSQPRTQTRDAAAPAVVASIVNATDRAVASPVPTANDAARSVDAPSIVSGVEVETHFAVPATHSAPPSKDAAADEVGSPRVRIETAEPIDTSPVMAQPTRDVVRAVETMLDQAPAVAPPSDTIANAAPAPARTLTLLLEPATLGTVEVRLHMSGQALDLQLSVSSKETLRIISRDRDHLETALAGQNYDLRSLTIQSAAGAAAGNMGGAAGSDAGASNQGTTNQGMGGQTGPGGQGASAFGNGSRRAAQIKETSSDEIARAPGAVRAGALFV